MAPHRRSWRWAAAATVAATCSLGAEGRALKAASSTSAADLKKGKPLKETLPWVHSQQELHDALQDLVNNCEDADISMTQSSRINGADAAGETVTLDVLRIKGKNSKADTKAMLVFGEHARELITGEAALGLVRTLCGKGTSSERAKSVLQNAEFVIVPNANPIGRKMVEEGYYCKRTNEDSVDLNRNWSDEHRDTSLEKGDEMYPGSAGFSEPETQMLKEIVDGERPNIYLSVHSGAYLLGMPYGFARDQMPKPQDEAAMMEVLKPISDNYCGGGCPFGNLAEMINYDNPGCDIDYVYETLGTPYVFTWEIYVGEDIRQRYLAEADMRRRRELAGGKDNLDGLGFLQKRRSALRGGSTMHSSLELEVEGPEDAEGIDGCLDQFNPLSSAETDSVVENWAGAFLELCDSVHKRNLNATSTAAAAAPSSTGGSSGDDAAQPAAPALPDFSAKSAPAADAAAAVAVEAAPAREKEDPIRAMQSLLSESRW
eukprot:TRINITY_DN17541_c0_g1_i1.p1 TRINITY_DN17541_c0_g1~~TRINITY_DN17541_c0_g1_i1.p1  ORF type:complete len:509 (+),score=136.91 TRINITY_DN17541_c0_g1_i1:64-1527(+)